MSDSSDKSKPSLAKISPLSYIAADLEYIRQCGPKSPLPWEMPPGQEYTPPPHVEGPGDVD